MWGTAGIARLTVDLQIDLDNLQRYSNIILNHFYVDDLISGSHTEFELINFRDNLINILNSAGFPLRKFRSNKPRILESIVNKSEPFLKHIVADKHNTKTLGICWNSLIDKFEYTSRINSTSGAITKTSPIHNFPNFWPVRFLGTGLLGPIIIQSKILLPKLWMNNISWVKLIPPYSISFLRWFCRTVV